MDKEYTLERLAAIVGPEYVTNEPFILMAYTQDFGTQPPRWPAFVVKPGTVDEVAAVLRLANELKIPISPRGGGSAQEGGCQSDDGIILETLRLDKILEIDEDAGTVTAEAGLTFVKLMAVLEEQGWKIGIAPSGAMAGTIGAHVSRPGVGWGNIKYMTQGQQVIGLKVVLPTGDIVQTGSAANPDASSFIRYALGPDMTGLFIGAEGAFGIVVEATLHIYPWPEKIYLERYVGTNLGDGIDIFRELAHHRLVCYVSVPVIKPDGFMFDVNVEGDKVEVEHRVARIRSIVSRYPSVRLEGSEAPQRFWDYRWFNTGEEFKDGIAGAVTFFLPFAKLEEATYAMREIMEQHGIRKYSQQLFPQPTGSEHVSLLFHHPSDKEEYAKIQAALPEIMDKALSMGGVPYTKGRQWVPHLKAHLGDTQYWRTLEALKQLLDPNHIMNPAVLGLK
ncbi:MAG TPA: FAD-binding oxidoreductase [Anaerolineae bacterium]|nr:FAD-binding oxidoreductase [Anaerolineae bacterium]